MNSMKVEFELDDDLADQIVVQNLTNTLDLLEKRYRPTEDELIDSVKDVIEYYGG